MKENYNRESTTERPIAIDVTHATQQNYLMNKNTLERHEEMQRIPQEDELIDVPESVNVINYMGRCAWWFGNDGGDIGEKILGKPGKVFGKVAGSTLGLIYGLVDGIVDQFR